MVFKKLLGALGVGGPSVDTVLEGGSVLPGGTLRGQVHLEGGKADAEIERITLELVARVEAENGDMEHEGIVVFGRTAVGGGFRLAEGERRSVPFELPLPWETPVNELYGQPLGVVLGVRTELAVAGSKDKGDLDAMAVGPLPVQEAVLEAFGQLGFGFVSADLELGHIHGTGQALPFYQEIELSPSLRYAHAMRGIELTFLTGPDGAEIVLEADGGHDGLARFHVTHGSAAHLDWNAEVDGWVRELVDRLGTRPHHGSGPGMVAGAAAVGVIGGMVAGEVIEEVVEEFFEDFGDEEG